MESLGVEAFRVGGTSGGWKMIFGAMAEAGEGMCDLEMFACQSCRRVEFALPDDT
jgi:hypothetical protein